jgi:HPt (histidine-containing phosphotransfer) domain-containing protein
VSDEPTLDPVAFERLLDITGGDLEFVDELVDTYLEDAVVQVAALRGAVASGVIEDLVRPAHSLKSGSDNVGAPALTTMCRALEAASRTGTVADAAGTVERIALEFDAVRSGLLAERAAR